MDNRPIGIFDSGMGGLTVRAGIARLLPTESLLYFGDGLNVPYGPRPREEITAFVDRAVDILLDRNIKMLVVACNAATGAAIDHLRARLDIPVIGMEPAVKPAALTSRSGVVGVLATAAAFQGELYKATAARYRDLVRLIETVGEGFVELVENDLEETPRALEVVSRAVGPMLDAGADRIVLGCTHYPFLEKQIRRVVDGRRENGGGLGANGQPPEEVVIIDSAAATARRIASLLTEGELHAAPDNVPKHEFLSFAGDEYTECLARKSTVPPECRY